MAVTEPEDKFMRHVKANAAWKNVEIPQQLMDNELFHGLIDVQELSDYEIVSDKHIFPAVKSTPKKRKRKRDSDESELFPSNSHWGKKPNTSPNVLQKDFKKAKIVKKCQNLDLHTGAAEISSDQALESSADCKTVIPEIVDDGAEVIHASKKKRRKKKKKKTLKVTQQSKADSVSDRKFCDDTMNQISASALPKTAIKDMIQWKNLFVPEELMGSLEEQGFVNPTEIQLLALPFAIRDKKDIIGAAETGSGKTLAFGIPVLAQILTLRKTKMEKGSENPVDSGEEKDVTTILKLKKSARESGPKALILEPTRELAIQVQKHLIRLASHTDIKFASVVGGMSIEKQCRVLKQAPDVIIATPGRLWQLIEEGEQHLSQVDCVHSLVIDEADRMIEKGHYEELTKLLQFIKESPRRVKKRQTYVMSATLSMEIPTSHGLKKTDKKRTPSESKLKNLTDICSGSKTKIIDLTRKDKVALTLTELRISCTTEEKDFYLYYFLCEHPGRTLVFVNSKDCLRRLVSLFTLLQCSPLPLHADMHQTQRLKNLDRFTGEKMALLIASDVAARGLDIPKIDHVIHYQVPHTIENYVHRSGRTARASSLGLTLMLVGAEDTRDYRKIVHFVKNGKEIPIMPYDEDLMPSVKRRVELARSIDVQEHRSKKKRIHNNFFRKAAQAMDIILDDNNLLPDLGSTEEQSQEKQDLRAMKDQLLGLLKTPLASLHMTKYPTKSGRLMFKKSVDLYNV